MSDTERNTKVEVEELLGTEITEEQFKEALEYAKRKQKYIYEREQRGVVMQHWYLVELIKESVVSFEFSRITMKICELSNRMEKEHFTHTRSALQAPSIVSVPVQ